MLKGEELALDTESLFRSTGRTGSDRLIEFWGEDVVKITHTITFPITMYEAKAGQ